MPRYLILAQADHLGVAARNKLSTIGPPGPPTKDAPILAFQQSVIPSGVLADTFLSLTKSIEQHIESGVDCVIVDGVSSTKLCATAEAAWEPLVAMLILAFPDIRWLFATHDGVEAWPRFEADHVLSLSTAADVSTPLFDGSGLRNELRRAINEKLREHGFQIPTRRARAAIVEDELAFAYLHGCTAYRFGCLSDLVTTWSQMSARFAEHPDASHNYWLLVEDMSLNFSDREPSASLLNLRDRQEQCPQLASGKASIEVSNYRALVTTGQSRLNDATMDANRAYLRAKAYGIGRIVTKPTGGMSALWKRAGLLRRVHLSTGSDILSARVGNAPGYDWPPKLAMEAHANPRHGAPGRLELIAECLIERARRHLAEQPSLRSAITGAVLATDALELTGARVPTLAIEALSLKHQLEVVAECQFSGVEYHIWLEHRLGEIRRDVAAISRRFGRRHRSAAALNSEMKILVTLVRIFKDHGQFDEEQKCLARARNIQNTLWMRQRPHRMLLWPILRYLELLLTSVSVYAGVLALWVVALSALYWWTSPASSLPCSFFDAVTSMFSIGAPFRPNTLCPENLTSPVIVSVAIVSGFLHLGVFISHLYSLLSRR